MKNLNAKKFIKIQHKNTDMMQKEIKYRVIQFMIFKR